MKLLVFILNKEELLETVMEAYVEADINGATILDSEGMGHFLANEVPLFADFKDFMKGNRPRNRTILSVVKDPDAVDRLMPILDAAVGGFKESGAGIMFTLPVDWVHGIGRLDEGECPS